MTEMKIKCACCEDTGEVRHFGTGEMPEPCENCDVWNKNKEIERLQKQLDNQIAAVVKPCPFCGQQPELSAYQGTELDLTCCYACVSLQVQDRMTMAEREADGFANYCYATKYYDRIKTELIEIWNTRHKE